MSSALTKVSVEPHQQVTKREAREVLRKLAISSLICKASSYLFFPFLMFGPSSSFTKSWSNAAFMGLMVERKGFTFSKSWGFKTPALAADWYALSLKISHPPNLRSVSSARGTNFLMSGERASVRFPRRMVPICVSDPTGCDLPLRTSSTPAMKVVLTAPMPGSITPSFPLAGAILEGFSMPLLLLNDRNTIDGKNELKTRIAAAEACCVPKQTNNDEGRLEDLQIEGTGTSAPCERSFVGRQEFPDGSVFLPENPGAEPLQAAVFHQRIALAEGAGVGEKYPFAQVVAIEEKPGGTVDRIPFEAAVVSPGEIQGVVGGDVFRAGVGLVRGREAGLRGSFHRRPGEPMIAIERDSQ